MATKKKANWNKEVRTTTDEEKQAWQYKGKDKDVATYDAKKMLEAWKQKVNSKEFDEYVKAETAYQEYQRKLKEVKSKLTETGSTSYEDYYQRQLKANKQATNALNWESFKRTLGDKLGFRADSYDEALKTKQASDEALSYATQYRHADAYQDANFKTKSAKGLQAAADDLAVYNTEMGKGRVGGKTWSDWISNTDTDLMVRLSGNDVTTYMPTDSWTDDQRELFGYYYATDKEKAIELGSSINRQAENAADKAAQEALAKEYGNASTLGKIGYGAASIVAGASPLGVKDYAYNALGYIGNGSNWVGMEGLTDTQVINGIDSAISESLNAQSGTINESVPILGGKGAGDAYQLGKSILDSIITARVSSGITKAALKNGATEKAAEWAGKAITYGVFFGNAAAQSYDDAMQRGATPGQAVYLGLADGVAEALFEEFSIEQLIRIGDSATLKELAINILKQNATEGSEELFTSIANTISDALIMQQNSSQQQKIDELVAQGYSYKDAYKIAVKDTVGGIIYDALAGAVSGGVSGSIYGGINYAVNNSTARYADGSKVNATDFYNMSGEVAGENTADVIAKVQSENKGRKSDTLTRGQVSRIRETWDADKYAAKVSETQAKVDEAKAKLTAAVQNNAEAVDNVNSLMSEGARRESQSKPVMAGQSIELEGQKLTTAENNTFSVRGGSLYLNATTENGEEAYIDLNNKSVLESLPADVQSAVEYARTLFGDQAHIVLNAYDASMPIETYMTAMDTAVNMYEANGMDVEKASNMSLTRALSTAQVQAAKRVGLIASEAGINAAETAAAKFKTARAALEAKQAEGTATIKDFNSTIRSIRGMLKTERSQLETVNRQLANAEQGSEQYKALESKKARLEAEITGNERAIEQMQAEAQRIKDERRIDSKVSTDGGTVYENGEKIELKAVDTSKLSDKQKRMVDFVNKLSGIFELDFVLFDGDAKGAQGAYTGGGTIYVNINAGLAANKTLIAQAISHELTHYMQAYAPAEYAELKKYVQNKYLELNATEFEQLVRDRMEAGKLTEAKAIDEIVANACEEMLFDSRAIRKLAAENMTLAEKIRDFLKDMRQRLEDAFGDKDDIRREAVFAREFKEQLADMQELWDKGIYEAVHNRRAENAKPRPAAVPSMSVEDYESVTRAGYDSIGALTDEGMEEVANAAARAGALNDKLQEIKSNPQYQTWYETSREARRELTALDEAYENNDAKYIDSQVASGKIHADVGERLKTIAQLRQDVFAYLETMPEYRAFKNEPGYMWEDEFAGLFDWDFDPYSADAGNGDAVAQLLNSFMTDELEQLSGRKAERFKVQGYKLLEFMVEGMDALDKERWGYTFADKNWNKDFAKWYEARHPYNEVPLSDYAMSTAEAEEIGEDGLRFQSWDQPENGKAIRKVLAGSMFSGGGTVDFALSAIIDSQFAVEYNPKISAVFRQNNETTYMGQDATKFDPRAIKGKVEYFHASPECKTDSNMISTAAKADRIGKGIDIDSAEAVVRVIDEKEPDAFTLENVPGYKDTEAMQIITDALDGHGYVYDVNTYDAADYGAATSRKRIFLRALRNGQLPALPEKVSRRTSWGEAAGDLLESLPEAKTVNPRMVNSLLNISGIDVDAIEQPLLVFGESYKNGEFGHAYYDETMPTLIANSGASRVFMPDGRVLEATPRLLARISGLPDDYKLPSDKVTARKIIGNGVPVKLTQAVAGGLLNGMTGQSVQFQTWDGEELQKLADEDKPMTATQEVQYSTWADKDFMDKAENKLIKDKKFKASVIGQRGQAAYDSLIEDMKGARSAREAVKKLLRDPNLVDSLRLPPDVMGNTLITNSSYGGTEENRPVCVRSLGAQALLDLVSDYFNRPLTVNETLQISEEIMATANKPECIYCYVAQDRRAYREFLGEYVKQRNAAIKDLKDGLNYDTAYKDYLNGRDDTDNSAHRFALFQKIADGELKPIAEKDLANLDRLLSEASSLKADIIEYAAKMTGRAEKKLSIVSNGGTQTVKYNTNSKKESNEFLVTVDELLNEPAIADKAARFIQLADAMAYAQSASWAKKMTPYAAYNGHILKMKSDRVDFLNDHYGLRMYSFSDFSPAFILENMQMITDAAVKGLKVLAYTKELDFVKIFADTGANINISVFAAHAIPEDRNSAVIPDGMMGADWNEAIALREKYPNVGLTLVATDDEIIEWAKTSDYGKYVDVIIPFHIVRTGEETAQFFNYINFTKESADKGLLDSKYYEENNIPKTVYPSEHNNEFKTYMEFVNERHLTPRFARYINGYEAYLDGEISLDDLVNLNSDGFYMKFVNETRRSANDTPAVRAYWTDENLKVAESSIRQMAKDGGYGAYGPYAIGGKTERAQQKNAERIIRKLESNGSERVPESGTLQLQKWDNDHPDLLAVHNVTEEKLLAAIKLGGLPMPSLAIIRADDGHTNYGGISLVFGKDSIDPQINRNNKIYGADAYTPTKVDLEYPVVSKVEFAVDNEIRDLAAKVADGIFSGGALNHAINYWGTSYLNLDQIADKLSRVDAVKAAYAAEHGVEIEPVMMNTKYHALGNDFLKKYIDFIGHQKLAQLAAETLANYKINDDDLSILTEFIAENVNPDNPKLAQARARMYREQDKYVKLIRSAWKMYEENGYGATEIDKLATLEELKSKVSDADAKKWIRGKIDGLLGEPGIWNGKEAYDEYSGERLPFNKTHMPYTLNNIIKAMRAANRERGSGVTVGATHLQSITAKEYKNMADVKADSFRIGTVDEAEYSARVGAVDNMLTEVVADIADSNNLDRSNVGADVIECARVVGAGSAESIRKYFRDTAKTPITKAQAEKLAEVYYESSILPTGYFEAKPYRAMGFDEVLAAVIPDTTSAEVKRALADNGVEMLTYKNEDDADRLAKLNSVEGARFQKWDDGTRKSKGIIVDEQEALTRLKSENYQLEEMVKQLTKERDKARKEAAESGRQLTITRSNEVRKSDSDKLTNRYIKEMGYTGTAEEKAQLRDAMKDLGDYVVNATGETVDYGVLKSKARAIAGELVRNASVFLDEGRTEEIGIRDHMDNLYKELTRRTYRLSKQDVGEIEAQYGSLKNFRDKYFGRFFISETKGESIDSIYSELRGDMGADRETFREYLPEANNPGEMLLNIAAAVDRVERVYGNPYDGNIEESTEAQANEIIFDVISDEVRQALPTFADVKEAQIEATRAKGAAKARKAYELGVARLNALRDEKNARITQVRQQGIASKKAAVAKEKALKWEAVAKERDYWRNRIAEANAHRNESTAVKKYLKRIKKDVADLIEWSVKPSNKDIRKHVPAEIQSAVRDFVLSIDMSSKRLLSGGEETQSDRAVAKAMEKMRRILDSKVNTGEIYSGRYDLPSNFIEEFGKLTDAVNELTSKGKGGYVLNAMSSTELRELSDTLKVLKKLITDMNVLHNNQMFAHDYEAGENSTKFIEKLGEAQPHKAEGVYKFMGFDNMRPIYVFDRFGEGGQSIFNEFVEAQAKLAKLTNEIIRFRDNNYDAEKAQKWAEEMHEFEVHGETIKMSTAQLMSLYCLNRREQGKTHIFGEGFRVANTKVSKKNKLGIVTSSYTYRDAGHQITQEDIGKMLEALTPDQIKVAEAMQEFMSTTCSGWGNEVTRIRFDVDGFTEPYYFPINSDGRILPANADEMPSNASLYALLNAGFTKELKENANNRIILYNIFDVFANHTASMAQYRAFALPVLDALKWFNYANEDTSLRDEMAKAFGAPEEKSGSGSKGYAESFVINFIKAVNGTAVQGDPYDGMMMSLLHSYNRAAIAFNGRVVIQQPMAITRAAMFLKSADLIEGMKKSLASKWKLAEEMESYSGMAQWKALGFYDTNVSRGLTDMISFRESLGEKVTELGTSWAEKADRLTWAAIWYAAKQSVNRADYGTEAEYFDAVVQVFENVIVRSQVVDSIVTKSEFMRAKGFVARSFGSFMGEPTTTISMLSDAGFRYELDVQSGMTGRDAFKKNSKYIKATIANYVVSQALLAVVQSIYDAWRDDDEYKTWLEKYLEALKGNLISELNPLGKIPYVKDLIEVTKEVLRAFGADTYGNVNNGILGTISEYTVKIAQMVAEMMSEDGSNYTGWALLYKCLQLGSATTGLPMAQIYREARDLWNNTVGKWAHMPIKHYDGGAQNEVKWAYQDGNLTEEEAVEELLTKTDDSGNPLVESREEALKLIYGWGTKGSSYDAIKKEVESGTQASFEAVKNDMLEHGYGEDAINNTVKNYIKELYTDSSKSFGKTDAVAALTDYVGYDAKTANDVVSWWWADKEYGMQIDADGNGSVKMDELGDVLNQLIRKGEIDSTQAQSIWHGCNPKWKTSYADWKKKQSK